MDDIAESILNDVRGLGYTVSAHAMGEYVEMHAVLLVDPDQPVKIARCGGGEGDEAQRQSAAALAEMINTNS